MPILTIDESRQKQQGQYYTPSAIAEFLVAWAIRSKTDRVFDPSFGEGVFLTESYKRLRQLGATSEEAVSQIYGAELDPDTYAEGRRRLREIAGCEAANLLNRDFFDISVQPVLDASRRLLPSIDVIVGNPPFVRYQLITQAVIQKALAAASQAGVRISRLTSLWAPFLVHASEFLGKDGRLAMVVPIELFHAQYAGPVRKYLMTRFPSISIVAFEQQVFPGALADTTLLLASRQPGNPIITVHRAHDLADLDKPTLMARTEVIRADQPNGHEKWMRLLLSEEEYHVFQQVSQANQVVDLKKVASVDIGVVTGANEYFILSKDEVEAWGVTNPFLERAVPKSAFLKGLAFTKEEWEAHYRNGEKCALLHVAVNPEEAKTLPFWPYLESIRPRIIAHFKIRTREPWYAVPSVKAPGAFLSYMINQTPRFALNDANAVSTNTVHAVRFLQKLDLTTVVIGFYNTYTLLSAELAGRTYGGGVLKIEPTEAERIKVIRPSLPGLVAELTSKSKTIDLMLRAGQHSSVIDAVDQILLESELSLKTRQIELLRHAYASLQGRRFSKIRKHVSRSEP